MDGSGHKFLPRAACPFDERSAVTFGHLGQDVENLPHRTAATNDIRKGVLRGEFFPQFLHRSQVAKGLDTTDRVSFGVPKDAR